MNEFTCPCCKSRIETDYKDSVLVNSTMDCPECNETIFFSLVPVAMAERMSEIYSQYKNS